MDLNFREIERKAEDQREARAAESRKRLAEMREREAAESAKWGQLLKKFGEKLDEEGKASMEAQIVAEEEKAKAEIRAKYAKKYGEREWNESDNAPLKKMLSGLLGHRR